MMNSDPTALALESKRCPYTPQLLPSWFRLDQTTTKFPPESVATALGVGAEGLLVAVGRRIDAEFRACRCARRVVVDVDDGDIRRVHPAVLRVGAGRGGGDDGVGDVAVVDASSTPVTVTVCASSSSPRVNVRLAGDDRAFGRIARAQADVTFAVGWLVSTTVNVAVPPASVVVRPVVGVTVMPAVSLSVLVTATSVGVERRCSSRRCWSPAR